MNIPRLLFSVLLLLPSSGGSGGALLRCTVLSSAVEKPPAVRMSEHVLQHGPWWEKQTLQPYETYLCLWTSVDVVHRWANTQSFSLFSIFTHCRIWSRCLGDFELVCCSNSTGRRQVEHSKMFIEPPDLLVKRHLCITLTEVEMDLTAVDLIHLLIIFETLFLKHHLWESVLCVMRSV